MVDLLTAIDWDGLSNSVVGSFLSALLGALSALLVVYFTNRHSKNQAAKERTIRAIADLVAASQSVYFINNKEDITRGLDSMESALIRLRLSHDDGAELFEAMRYWPTGLTQLQGLHLRNRLPRKARDRCRSTLRKAGVQVRSYLPDWVDGSKGKRQEILKVLREESNNIQTAIDKAPDSFP